jgi:hypothetical protein
MKSMAASCRVSRNFKVDFDEIAERILRIEGLTFGLTSCAWLNRMEGLPTGSVSTDEHLRAASAALKKAIVDALEKAATSNSKELS